LYLLIILCDELVIGQVFKSFSSFPSSSSSSSSTSRASRQALFNVVSFPNIPCRGTNNLNGTCLTSSECIGTGGENQGLCASGFGTCCFYSLKTCGGDIIRNQSYVQNPNFPSSYNPGSSSDTSCSFNIYRTTSDVCQVRLDFETMEFGPPLYDATVNMECDGTNTDLLSFTPAGNKANGLALCGYNPGQHVYIDMGTVNASPDFAVMKMNFDATYYSTFARKWNILVSSIPCSSIYAAPRGCDQYFFGNEGAGVMQAFNYDQPTTAYIGKLKGYTKVCVRREKNMCTISYTPPDVDVDEFGFTVTGSANFNRGRLSCSNPRPLANPTPIQIFDSPGACKDNFIRIHQATTSGDAPYFSTSPPGVIGCDRFCGKRLCNVHNSCKGGDHMIMKSRKTPFEVDVEFSDHPSANPLKGYKLNYWQESC